MGYSRAGFEVVGVDIKPQKNYPFEFHQADAMTYPLEGFEAIHASPPCQAYTPLKAMWNARDHPELVDATRDRLIANGKPYVIENVPGSPVHGLTLCGSMFGLGTGDAELRRHRLFEIWPMFMLTPPCAHGQRPRTAGVSVDAGGSSTREKNKSRVIGVYGGHGRDRRRRTNTQGFSTDERREAMGIAWMNGNELSQAIPPVYTEYIGLRLREAMR